MNTQPRITPEIQFCLQVLKDNNINNGMLFEKYLSKIKSSKQQFRLVPVSTDDFFVELASKMRELWPTGKKDGKYDWRESADELAKRLKWLWEKRNLGTYTIDDCLLVCRKYLSGFRDNMRYMKLLKYFIIKRKEMQMVNRDGSIGYTYESEFANMLETLTDEERQAAKDAEAVESALENYGGTLI